MSKFAEKKALKAYPIDIIPDEDTLGFTSSDRNEVIRIGYTKGYDQAMQDMVKDSDHLSCKKTMQDFLEKACEWLSKNARNYFSAYATSDKLIEDFKQYIKEEQ